MTTTATLPSSTHPDFTQGTHALKQQKYQVADGEKTKGEKIYDFHNYVTVGYGLNLALSLCLTEFFMHGRGRPIWNATEKPLVNLLEKAFNASAENAKSYANVIQTYFYLTSGGNAIAIPVLLAENNKSKLTYLANRLYAPETIPEDDPYKDMSAREILSRKFDENLLPQPIIEQPKHGLLNLIWRRSLGVATIAIGWGPLTNKLFGEGKIEKIGVDFSQAAMGKTGNAKLIELSNNPRFKNYAGWTLADGINTIITAALFSFTKGTKKNKEASPLEDNITIEPPAPDTSANQERLLVQDNTPTTHIQSPEIYANSNVALSKDEGRDMKELTAHASRVDDLRTHTSSEALRSF